MHFQSLLRYVRATCKKRGNDNSSGEQQFVLCLCLREIIKQTARYSCTPLPTIKVCRHHARNTRKQGRQQRQIKWKLFAVNMQKYTHTTDVYICICISVYVCACTGTQMKAASQLTAGGDRQLAGLTWLKLEVVVICAYFYSIGSIHTYTYVYTPHNFVSNISNK